MLFRERIQTLKNKSRVLLKSNKKSFNKLEQAELNRSRDHSNDHLPFELSASAKKGTRNTPLKRGNHTQHQPVPSPSPGLESDYYS